MTARPRDAHLEILQHRFETHPQRHPGIAWTAVVVRFKARPAALRSLQSMEASGGEPDVIGVDGVSGVLAICDCAAESPIGRRSLCYDRAALDARKENKPRGAAMEAAAAMGIELLTEAQYRALQELGEFDTKTSSWVIAPPEIRAAGGAIFCDRRYGRVFTSHNGPQSYYASRGFRGLLLV